MATLTPNEEAQIRANIAKAVEVAMQSVTSSDQGDDLEAITKIVSHALGLIDPNEANALKG